MIADEVEDEDESEDESILRMRIEDELPPIPLFTNPRPKNSSYFSSAATGLIIGCRHLEEQMNSLSLDLSLPDNEEDIGNFIGHFVQQMSSLSLEHKDVRNFLGHFVFWYSIRDNRAVNPRPALETFVEEYLERDQSFLHQHKGGDTLFQGLSEVAYFDFMHLEAYRIITYEGCCDPPRMRRSGREKVSVVPVNFLPKKKKTTLRGLITRYLRQAKKGSKGEYDCHRCGDWKKVTTQRVFTKCPEILVVQLSRQTPDGKKINRPIKIGKKVAIRDESGRLSKYKLAAALMHNGNTKMLSYYISCTNELDFQAMNQ